MNDEKLQRQHFQLTRELTEVIASQQRQLEGVYRALTAIVGALAAVTDNDSQPATDNIAAAVNEIRELERLFGLESGKKASKKPE